MRATIISYGVKWAAHPASLTIEPLDMRRFKNPYHDKKLRSLRGTDPAVLQEVFRSVAVLAELERVLAGIRDGDTFGVYCTAGHHRSVAFAHRLAEVLLARGWRVFVVHRDYGRERRCTNHAPMLCAAATPPEVGLVYRRMSDNA